MAELINQDIDLIKALHRIKVETGSLACLGCGHEHNCSTHGCAIMREAADRIEELQAENEQLKNQLSRKTEQLDAAVGDLRKLAHEHCTCYACINNKFDYDKSVCAGCQYNNWNNWQWRGEGKA